MIQELVEFGKRVTKGKDRAFKEEHFSITLVIDEEGRYQQFIIGERIPIEAEVITAKKGKARFLLDKSEEVLGMTIDVGKVETFKKRFEAFKDVSSLSPVFKFYDKRNANGLRKAIVAYLGLDDEHRGHNMSFVVNSTVLLSAKEVQDAVCKHHCEQKAKAKKNDALSLKEVPFDLGIAINEDGEFQDFIINGHHTVNTEVSVTKKKETYLLIGSDEDVFGITKKGVDKKHQLFMDKLMLYKDDLPALEPVFKFYKNNNEDGLKKAIVDSVFRFTKDSTSENITFMMLGGQILLKSSDVRNAISRHFHDNEQKQSNGRICSICGKSDSPVLDEPHGYIHFKRRYIKKDGTLVQTGMGHPTGQNTLVSYNEKVFESYGLVGNLNSSICVSCARNYIAALNYLESKGNKRENHYHYEHRVDISDSTIALFWTRKDVEDFNQFDAIIAPDSSYVKNMLESSWKGDVRLGSTVDTNMFYSITLSPSARTAVRDWTAISLKDYKNNIAEWFRDIEVEGREGKCFYSPLRSMIEATQRDLKPNEKPPQKDLYSKSRIGALLWNSAIKGRAYKIPLEVLQYSLARIWKGDTFSVARAAIIKLVINRNTDKNMKSTLDESNTSVAYLCGRLFAVIESMQWKAITGGEKGKKVNNGIKERFFVAAASQPAYVLGALLTKNVTIYQRKIGGYLAKELDDIAGKISKFGKLPHRFSTIEQGEFALGYYFQRNHKNEGETKDNINS